MMLLLSTVCLSDLYLNVEQLLFLISPTTSPMTWRKSRSVPSPLSILLLYAKMHLLRQGSQASSKVVKMLVSMLKKRVSPENPTFSLIQGRIVQSSLAYCTPSNRSFTTLPSNTDCCTNFVQMSVVAVLYLPNIFFKLLMRQVAVHGLAM